MKSALRCLPALFLLFVWNFSSAQSVKVNWMSFEDAVAANAKSSKPKKIFIDVYTDWCGWCTRMDQSTFQDSTVKALLVKHFLAVKLNAERKDTVRFNDNVYVNPSPGTPRSTHQLAISLLKGQLSYPSFLVMNEKHETIQILKGYREAKDFAPILRYFGEDIYLKKTWDEYQKGLTSGQ